MRKLLCSCAVVAAMLAPQIAQARTDPPANKKLHHTATDGKKAKTASPQAASTSAAPSGTSTTPRSSSTPSTTTANGGVRSKTFTSNPDNPLEAYPQWLPMAAFTGGLGLFTIDTGDTLPAHGLTFEAGANKFSRDPGSITVLQTGWSLGYGITNRVTAFMQFDVHNHVHVDNPAELSLDAGTGPQYGNTIYNTIVPGGAPAYVEDYPFAYTNDGGIGNIDVGAEYGLLSERRGDKASLAIRGDVFVPTVTSISDLLVNQSQSGAADFQFGANLSKTILDDELVLTSDFGYRITRNPPVEFNNSPALTRADEINVGAGFLAFPQHRIQLMSEYTGVVFVGSHTPDTSFGARDPVDTVWGIRAYLTQYIAVDVGYRYMLNLHDVLDRNGFVIKVGSSYWPEKIAPLPTVSVQLTVDPTSVVQDSGQMVSASARATDSQNLPLNYTWTATGGNIVGTGPNVRWDPSGLAPGQYTISATADDARGGTDSASAQVTVQPKPAPPPTMSCSVDRATVQAGEKVNVTASVNDQTGTALTYQWQANAGQISGSGASVQLDTTGLAAGNYTITGRVQNGRGGAADCTATVGVQVPPPPPQASKINQCYFTLHSARIDNVCKRILDDVAVRLQTDPKAKIVVIGYATPRHGSAQRLADKLAKDRAENAKKYLSQKKGVDASRIDTRTGAGALKAGKENRRMDIILVPDGASY